jgi:hypothetical protein
MNEVLMDAPALPQPTDRFLSLQILVSSTTSAFLMVLYNKFEE